jgi:RNA polymerase sigma factor (sigma-70 family)
MQQFRVCDWSMAMQTFSAEDALLSCARGDKAALRRIYEQEAPRMLGVAMRFVKRRALAEEIVHDCFLRIWNAAGAFDPARGSGRAWMYAILRNHALNVLRGEARLELTGECEPIDSASGDPTPEETLIQVSEGAALRLCLETLEPGRRQIIVLAYTEGLSHGEIAARIGVPLGTVKSWIRRSLLKLKACLQ